jgi:hypothetical protein
MDHFEELLDIVNNSSNSETGGGHGQKGVEFQRHWAMSHMFNLADNGVDDFLVIFEAIQDVAVYDSANEPKSLKIYQIKKKDRNEWGWKDLTGLYVITKKMSKSQPIEKVKESTIGKLYASVKSVKKINVSGYFISNAGCNLALDGGGNAATVVSCSLNELESDYRNVLANGLEQLHNAGESAPDLTKIVISKTNIPVDDPKTYLVGEVHQFLTRLSPKHANQAHALVDALMAKIAPLGAKTDKSTSFDQLIQRQGFSKKDFNQVLSDLEKIPDLLEYLKEWLQQLQSEGMSYFEITSIKAAAAGIYRDQLLKIQHEDIQSLADKCDALIAEKAMPVNLRVYFEELHSALSEQFTDTKRATIYAIIALRGIKSCVDQI